MLAYAMLYDRTIVLNSETLASLTSRLESITSYGVRKVRHCRSSLLRIYYLTMKINRKHISS